MDIKDNKSDININPILPFFFNFNLKEANILNRFKTANTMKIGIKYFVGITFKRLIKISNIVLTIKVIKLVILFIIFFFTLSPCFF